MMVRPQKIEDFDDLKTWIADHEARSDTRWEVQFDHNARIERDLLALGTRITALEKRVMWVAGIFAGAGSTIGTLFVQALGGG